ncbi:MAG TPA: glucose/galactose MFS transporter [Bacteroidales bacterium]|nr:glucose/galactose MFS transporter [Bacteroidales bacterium]
MSTSQRTLVAPLMIIGSMFGVLGFALGINAFFIPFVQKAFDISITMSYLVMTATFASFVVFGLPSGYIIKKAGYKGGMILAFLIMAVGFYLIAPAAKHINFYLFLIALFISGMGQTLLTGAVNTYVSILGPGESAAARIAGMGICSKTFYALASLLLSLFMDLSNVHLEDTILPFYIIAGVLVLMGVMYYFAPLPEIKAAGEDETDSASEVSAYANAKTSILQFPHLLLGVAAIFFDVGVEYTALGSINDYAAFLGLPSPQNYVWFVSGGMVLGYLIGVMFIPKYISQGKALLVSTIAAIVVTIAIMIFPGKVSVYLVGLLGLANALLWPAIWPLAIADLGKFTKMGSSFLVTGIIGGAFLPLLFGYIADIASHQTAYVVCLPAYFFIMYYSLSGSKIRTGK